MGNTSYHFLTNKKPKIWNYKHNDYQRCQLSCKEWSPSCLLRRTHLYAFSCWWPRAKNSQQIPQLVVPMQDRPLLAPLRPNEVAGNTTPNNAILKSSPHDSTSNVDYRREKLSSFVDEKDLPKNKICRLQDSLFPHYLAEGEWSLIHLDQDCLETLSVWHLQVVGEERPTCDLLRQNP